MGLTRFPFGIGVGKQKRVAGSTPPYGWEVACPVMVDLGTPIATDDDAIIASATSTQLPNNSTKTYTTADIGTSPCDGDNSTWIFDVPRNIYTVTTHNSSIVAMTILVSGYDEYNVAMSELLTVTATGTSKTVQGKKAFKRLTSIAIASTGDATTNTLKLGFGDVLGLPLVMARNTVMVELQDNAKATAGTVVVAVTNTATTTTGDVRGTYDPNSSCNGSLQFRLVYIPSSLTTNGVTQA